MGLLKLSQQRLPGFGSEGLPLVCRRLAEWSGCWPSGVRVRLIANAVTAMSDALEPHDTPPYPFMPLSTIAPGRERAATQDTVYGTWLEAPDCRRG